MRFAILLLNPSHADGKVLYDDLPVLCGKGNGDNDPWYEDLKHALAVRAQFQSFSPSKSYIIIKEEV
jgi:hypothetical protein